jgi:hypothetical protein
MKNNLTEELQKIHSITYGENIVIEEGFLDNILRKIGLKKEEDPRKGDFASTDIQQFYQTLEEAANNGGLSQQRMGSMEYQKGVESMQIGLILLGIPLPKYGVDGLFGPETSSAVSQFINTYLQGQPITTSSADNTMLTKMIELLKEKNITPQDIAPYINSTTEQSSGGQFTVVDLSTNEGYQKYADICQAFINTRQPNPLNITGTMLADAAVRAFKKYNQYVPPELSLSQLVLEGGIGNGDMKSRPIRTRNPYNVGNVDNGMNVTRSDVQSGINAYYDLIASTYLSGGKSPSDLVNNFVNQRGERYASSSEYETNLGALAGQVSKIAQTVT